MAVQLERPRSVKLAGVKHCLYHPLLPTFRRMEMDNVACKLPDDHSRTSTICTAGKCEGYPHFSLDLDIATM